MDWLAHGALVRVLDADATRIFRVLFDAPEIGKVVCAQLYCSEPPKPHRGGRRRKVPEANPRKKAPMPLVGELVWRDRDELARMQEDRSLFALELELDRSQCLPLNTHNAALLERRIRCAAPFLDLDHLRDEILSSGSLATLINEAQKLGASKSLAYGIFSLLCRYGFFEHALRPRKDRCGAPGVLRPCGEAERPRKKAGRKTANQRQTLRRGLVAEPEQPGMTSDWRRRILAADSRISQPKPKWPARCLRILESSFVTRYREEDGRLIPAEMPLGSYPSRSQIKHVLTRELPLLMRIAEKTTKGHFARSHRGLHGRAWKGVSGPGHTWAIDSTVGDIYLRSSVDRSWIIGRPIVYTIVDVWSSAVVGFYVCLEDPSWEMAKLALFSAAADPQLIGVLWGYTPVLSLSPAPTLPVVLLCDRGEYLSKGARQTGIKLIPDLAYAPPYRPDLKGSVEVLHRIAKDQMFRFAPGAIDARRDEYELRRFRPDDAAFTVKEFVAYLYSIYTEYNLAARREERLDAHMHAQGVVPCPAGLWRWGHSMGLGVQRALPPSLLISELLSEGLARVRRDAVRMMKRDYEAPEGWTTIARAGQGWDVQARYFPGSVSRIWVPSPASTVPLELALSDQSTASEELTFDEVADAHAYGLRDRPQTEHERTMIRLGERHRREELSQHAIEATREAESRSTGARPSLTEARRIEIDERGIAPSLPTPAPEDLPPPEPDDYTETMRRIMADMAREDGDD
ncbi:DDE-type integrase/transposase/recombinase [Niveibacterium sp. COAC-50]|uniref:DDE-type integrase/transposase/recombinase n=1 Tax=Niveibacterium sp. COAC-50 TaxID=2729384 RepID=UPI0015558B46|nr:DDE-type integrase/transposase/recombinase [Niveibacterium sp. COAC-50]